MKKPNRSLLLFFILTFVWTWAFYAPIVITGSSPYEMPGMVLLILGGAGPSIIGLALVFLTYDKARKLDYWRRAFSVKRIPPLWWAVIFLVFPLIIAVSIALDVLLGGSVPVMETLRSVSTNPLSLPMLILLWLMSGPVSEEFGWRGYALDPILQRFGVLAGSIILGIIWGVWHFPLFFMPATWHGQMGFQFAGFWTFIIMNVGLALIMTWVYLKTNRSILSAILLHFASNFTANLVLPVSNTVEIGRALLLLVIGLAACSLVERRAVGVQPAHQA